MDDFRLIENVTFNLSSVEHCRLGKEWNYENIISPFSRLYLISAGEAYILLGEKKVVLRQGYLYLIPSYQPCSYHCDHYMEQFYTTFTIHLPNELSIYQLYNFKVEVKASAFHHSLFEKLCETNPNRHLPVGDPMIYQKTNLNKLTARKGGAKAHMMTHGIIGLLFSEFFNSVKMDLKNESSGRITSSIMFIHKHLNRNLTVSELASKYAMSPDHYARKFKALTQQNPIDYINRQRIEKALLLLNTTAYTCKEIGYQCGFNSNTYFCKNFKKYVKQSPNEYRASLGSIEKG